MLRSERNIFRRRAGHLAFSGGYILNGYVFEKAFPVAAELEFLLRFPLFPNNVP